MTTLSSKPQLNLEVSALSFGSFQEFFVFQVQLKYKKYFLLSWPEISTLKLIPRKLLQ